MKNYYNTFIRSILAGIMISIAVIVFCMTDVVVGSILFGIGLYTIYTFKFNLFTGKVGYLFLDRNMNLIRLLIIWLGNFVGCLFTSFLVTFTSLIHNNNFLTTASNSVFIKLYDSNISTFILAMFCGMLMFIAIASYKRCTDLNNHLGAYLGIFLCVNVFIHAGFEHSIANMFYYLITSNINLTSIIDILIVSLGNAVGAIFLATLTFSYKFLK